MGRSGAGGLRAFRRRLHANPELSGQETATAGRVVKRLEHAGAARVVTGLGSMQTGVCAVYEGRQEGPGVLVRCELDALPIQERNRFEHRSTVPGVAHLCGHDGHMATLVALAGDLGANPIDRGRVFLLFQPAEETGAGAVAVLEDPRFRALGDPDYVYALHNVPKYPLGAVLLREGVFAQGSVGFIVNFAGRTSHASYPEHGVSPSAAVARLVTAVDAFGTSLAGKVAAPVLATISFARIGRAETGPNFGTAPGEACVSGVLRAQRSADLELLRAELGGLAARLAGESGLAHSLTWHEAFAATASDAGCVAMVRDAARRLRLEVRELDEPFRWSEDFGHFTAAFPGAFFGLGSGIDQPQLHDDGYDYPDDLIETGARLFRAIIDRHLEDRLKVDRLQDDRRGHRAPTRSGRPPGS
ncbi:MAG: amidohydrolase [Lysobacterales bacterium]|nr:MAG: amidohydrolase [Xanthomonadales bacterium]